MNPEKINIEIDFPPPVLEYHTPHLDVARIGPAQQWWIEHKRRTYRVLAVAGCLSVELGAWAAGRLGGIGWALWIIGMVAFLIGVMETAME